MKVIMENGQANVAVINAEETTNFLEVATNTTGIDWDIFCCKHGKNNMDSSSSRGRIVRNFSLQVIRPLKYAF